MNRAVFFDRDGIVNERRPDDYVTSWREFVFLPDVFSALPRAHTLGFLAIVITNQRGVSLGRMTMDDVDLIHDRMQFELQTRCGDSFDDIVVCPHGNDEGCDCRKPNPGMLVQSAEKWDVDCSRSWMIGDSETDVIAGARAGCRTILVGGATATTADVQCATLGAALEHIAAVCAAEGNG